VATTRIWRVKSGHTKTRIARQFLDTLRQELLVSLAAEARRLEKVTKQIDVSVECAFWGARADPC